MRSSCRADGRPRAEWGVAKRARLERGVSLVELLVGLAIGLFLLAGALSLFATQSQATAQTLLEAQLNRNLRQAMDFITQDVRRSGAWENAIAGSPSSTSTAVAVNPHASLSSTASSIDYSYGQDITRGQPSGFNLANVDEQFGVRLNAGVIEAEQSQGQWQALTDTRSVEITRLSVVPRVQTVQAADACRKRCCAAVAAPACPTVNAPDGCPRIERWAFEVAIDGRSRRDPNLTRTLTAQIQVRNELLLGRCPS